MSLFKKGRPPVTGFYLISNLYTHQLRDGHGNLHEERRRRPGAGSDVMSLAMVTLSGYTHNLGEPAVWVVGEGQTTLDVLERYDWCGPLPVPEQEEWMGLSTAARPPQVEVTA